MRIVSFVLVVILVSTMCPFLSAAQSSSDLYSSKRFSSGVGMFYLNGRWWNRLAQGEREAFLDGFAQSIWLLTQDVATAMPDKSCTDRFVETIKSTVNVGNFTGTEIAGQIDWFYSDSANSRIAVVDAILICLLRLQGSSKEDIEKSIELLRRTYSAHQ